jgi:hypothetical protein
LPLAMGYGVDAAPAWPVKNIGLMRAAAMAVALRIDFFRFIFMVVVSFLFLGSLTSLFVKFRASS